MLALLAVAIGAPALAQPRDGSSEKAAWEGYHGAVAEEANLIAEYNATLKRLEELRAQLAELDQQIEVTLRQLEAARLRLEQAELELLRGQVRQRDLRNALIQEIVRLSGQAVAAYMSGGSTRTAELFAVIRSSSPGELASSREYAGTVVENQAATVERVTALEGEAAQVERELATMAGATRRERDLIDASEKALQVKRIETERVRGQAEDETKKQRLLIARVQAKKAEFERRLYAIERESDNISVLLEKRQKDQKPLEKLPVLRSPLERSNVVSVFGMRLHPVFNEDRMHYGVDLPGVVGDPVYAAADGVVVFTQDQEGYGLVTVIDHGGQIASVYGHKSAFSVKVGQEVKRGDVIGKAGETGYATGPHVHFEYRLLGKPIDPTPFVDLEELLPATCEKLARSANRADRDLAVRRPECAAALATTATPSR